MGLIPLPFWPVVLLAISFDQRPRGLGVGGDIGVGLGADRFKLAARTVVVLVRQERGERVVVRRRSVVVFAGEGEGLLIAFAAVALERGPHHVFAGFGRLDAHLGQSAGCFGGGGERWAHDVVLAGEGAAAGGLGAGVRRGCGLDPSLLAVVTPSRLLRETFATGFEERAWHVSAEVEGHEQAMSAGESEDVGSAHCVGGREPMSRAVFL